MSGNNNQVTISGGEKHKTHFLKKIFHIFNFKESCDRNCIILMSSMFRLPLAGIVKLIIDPPLITFAYIVNLGPISYM